MNLIHKAWNPIMACRSSISEGHSEETNSIIKIEIISRVDTERIYGKVRWIKVRAVKRVRRVGK